MTTVAVLVYFDNYLGNRVHVQVPAMTAGTYAVTLNNGAVAFSGSVQVAPPITSTAQLLR